jgi:DNA-binding NtrC family response regulator
MDTQSTILIVNGESDDAENIARILRQRHAIIGPEDPDDALARMNDHDSVQLVICELHTNRFDGLELIRAWKDKGRKTPFLAVAEAGDVSAAVAAMKLGAADCLVKPVNEGKVVSAVNQILRSAGEGDDHVWQRETPVTEMKSQIDIPPGTSLEDLERAAVEQALTQHHGNRTHAAKTLGISVRTLQRKLKAWGMPLQSSPQRDKRKFLLPTNDPRHASPASYAPFHHAH